MNGFNSYFLKLFSWVGYFAILQLSLLFVTSQFLAAESVFYWPLMILQFLQLILMAVVLITSRSSDPNRQLHKLGLLLFSLLLAGEAAFYLCQFFTTKLKTVADALEKNNEDLINILRIFYFTLLGLSFVAAVFFQIFYSSLKVDSQKSLTLRNTIAASLIGLLLVFLTNFAALKYDISLDLTRFGRFSVSPAAAEIVKKIQVKISVTAFYSDLQEANIRREVELYLKDLMALNSNIEAVFADAFRDKDIALAKKISANGQIVFDSIDLSENDINKRLRSQKVIIQNESDLKKLEKETIGALLSVSTQRKKIYFLQGHGELTHEGPFTENLVSFFQAHLRINNYEVEALSVKNGFPKQIPADMAALLILNPQEKLNSDEQRALEDYLKKGGRLFLTTDLGSAENFDFILRKVGLKYNSEKLISESYFPPDKADLICFNYAEHPITSFLMRLPENGRYSLFPGSGFLSEENTGELWPNLQRDFFVKTHFQTYTEKAYIEKEKNQKNMGQKNLALAASVAQPKKGDSAKPDPNQINPKMRMVFFSDSNFISNKYIKSATANGYLGVNALKWLIEDDQVTALMAREFQDAPVKLSPRQKEWVRYLLIFIWPGFIIFIAFLFLRRRSRSNLLE